MEFNDSGGNQHVDNETESLLNYITLNYTNDNGNLIDLDSIQLNDDDIEFQRIQRREIVPSNITDTKVDLSTEDSNNSQSNRLKRAREYEEEDSNTCSICYSDWTNSGEHQISCLPCGHVFGKSCVKRWFQTKALDRGLNLAPCPFCGVYYKDKEIRSLYINNLKALDVTERDSALKKAEMARTQIELVQSELNKVKLSKDMIERELSKARKVIQELNRKVANCQSFGDIIPTDIIEVDSVAIISPYEIIIPSKHKGLNSAIFRFKAKVEVSNESNITRVMDVSNNEKIIFVGRKFDPTNFGITTIKLNQTNVQFSYRLHNSQLRDIKTQEIGTVIRLLTVSFDSTMVLSNPMEQKINHKFKLPGQGWSCCFNSKQKHFIYAGCGNSKIVEFDYNSILCQEPTRILHYPEITSQAPIHSLYFVELNQFEYLIGANIDGVYLWDLNFEGNISYNNHYNATKLCKKIIDKKDLNCSCYSLTYDHEKKMILASFRDSALKTTNHIIGKLMFNRHSSILSITSMVNITNHLDEVQFNKVADLKGYFQETSMPKTYLFFTDHAYFCARDELRKEILIYRLPAIEDGNSNTIIDEEQTLSFSRVRIVKVPHCY
ncbi:hypothetical protein K502DRAFT_352773 [Neoconidiobolus thromboides FSU 785]|nr:hypothetical protein K502DRAFT_352773 [Neoconidiobolus thromboides FSU 785]